MSDFHTRCLEFSFFVYVVDRYLINLCEVLRKSETGEVIMYSA